MKMKKIYYGSLAIAAMAGLAVSCSEEATLDGADAVYIELSPTDFSLTIGDTVAVTARVTNESGKVIDTPVKWSVDDPDVIEVLGDSAVTCLEGSQGKSTRLRATLINGQYGLTDITVGRHTFSSITPRMETYHTYSSTPIDTLTFFVEPAGLLKDYALSLSFEDVEGERYRGTGEFVAEGDGIDNINYNTGEVRVKFRPPRAAVNTKMKLSLLDENEQEVGSGETTLLCYPELVPGLYENNDDARPPTDHASADNGTKYEIYRDIDVNTEDAVKVSIGVLGGAAEDIANSIYAHTWEFEGSSVIPLRETVVTDNLGFIATMPIRSGYTTGETLVKFVYSDTTLVAHINVVNFNEDFPVEDLTVDQGSAISIVANTPTDISVTMTPASSFDYHVPEVTSSDESVVICTGRSNNIYTIRGLRPGTATLTFSSLDVTAMLSVTVTDEVTNLRWGQGNPVSMMAGQEATMNVLVTMASGLETTETVTWTSSDTGVLTITPVSGNTTQATVRAVGAGTATITASCGGRSVTQSISVTAVEDIDLNASNVDTENSGVMEGSSIEGGIMISVAMTSGDYCDIELPGFNGDYAGTYSGTAGGAVLVPGADEPVGTTSYNVTVTDNGDGTVTVNGTVELETGQTITLTNVMLNIW